MKHLIILTIAIGLGVFIGQSFVYLTGTLRDFAEAHEDVNHNNEFSSSISDDTNEAGIDNTETNVNDTNNKTRYNNFSNINIDFNTAGYNIMNENDKLPYFENTIFVVSDLESGSVILSSGDNNIESDIILNDSKSIASLTKLMTALISYKEFDLNSSIKISWDATATYGQQGNLSVGEIFSVEDIINITLLTSSNDGAEALAMNHEHGRDSLIKLMNQQATNLGMNETFYEDASGLSAKNNSSLNDLKILTEYLNNYYPEILKITKEKSYTTKGRTWFNNSKFRNDKNYFGGKNGYTDEARQTLIASFKLPLGQNNENKLTNGHQT
jgi:hypothetical protein